MKNNIYNNLGISLVSFLSVVNQLEFISFAKSLLIIPLALHDSLIGHIKKSNVIIRGIEDLILSKTGFFLNFNNRYFEFLPTSINTIIFAEKMNFISIEDKKIVPIQNQINNIDFNDEKLGKRAQNIFKATKNISKILNEEAQELYFKLRIEV